MALPVSTTHTIVGSIMGFSIAAKGFSSINVDIVVKIVISWVISPVVSGIIGFIFFWVIRRFVMRTDNPFERAYYSFPIILAIGIGIDLFFVLYKGLKNTAAKDFPLYASLPTSFAIGIVCGCLWIWPFGPRWKKLMEKQEREANNEKTGDDGVEAAITRELTNGNVEGVLNNEKDGSSGNDEERSEGSKEDEESPKESQSKVVKIQETAENGGSSKEGEEEVAPDGDEKKRGYFQRMSRSFAESTYDQDLHAQSMKESKRTSEI